ncbi:MAG TPA: FAD-dependent oxidoreductase [Stellaceae bacterium]|nr:FAD-dependent oxidoreductase [Stellaceae bacterium]
MTNAAAAAAPSIRCAIAGGGPAGIMLGLLLARAGVTVAVLEKHVDFFRDFRGDTIHPSTLELMRELGVLDDFLKLPHERVERLSGQFGTQRVVMADFSRLPVHCKFIAMMPQWDFLNFLASRAAAYPGFRLMMQTEVTDLIERDGAIVGLRATTPKGQIEVDAGLVVGADGRGSVVREKAGLPVLDLGAPMDVLWFKLSRAPTDTPESMGRFDAGRIFIAINRGAYWQCGYVIAKDSIERVRAAGLPAFRASVAEAAPYARDRVGEIADWNDVKLLTVRVDRLRKWWRDGLICIGDAAHAMSPIGGVGINLAVQDAVATANLLAAPLRAGRLAASDLSRVQQRREFPTRVTQNVQLFLQRRLVQRALGNAAPVEAPLVIRLATRLPFLSRLTARLLGLGVRPEHIAKT